jgi:hypothetical protein
MTQINTRSNYYDSVADNARSLISEAGAMPGNNEVHDAVNEAADSAVIYSSDCNEILRFTRNRDAAFTQIGPDCIAGKESASEVNTVLAYFAYSQDLQEALHEMDDDEAHELAGHHQCGECDEWHEDESESTECCQEAEEDEEDEQ